ncbi:zinc-binding dehydrogenase [Streptomyces sp. B1866]|uniref:zinc-binding dehydrogenase n=1 Tax=Streptomyces sp. B1866 TaxID=3075431 RepID=UPI00288FA5C1|nr:zinc-binding dehydrogenase [Streptomyces sp. B1866]MDT3395956.1 zinc-binding dehydrogenase [Streptomyces sp. B1866]
MYAVRLHAFGPAENLVHEKTDDPHPAPGQVRIAVAAAGVHLLDTALREGLAGGPMPPTDLPTIPGREVAGTVESLGEGTDARWLGRRVVAHLGLVPGGYAELAVTAAEKLHEIPDNLDAAQAVAMIGTGRTAMAILHLSELAEDDVVVVTAAAGGIGSLLVQYARNLGATVVGLAGGPAKAERVRSLGADAAVDYTADGWHARARDVLGGQGATVLFDSVGGDTARTAADLLGPGGRHLVYGWSAGGPLGGEPLTFTERELAERGITSRVLLGPGWLQQIGGDDPVRAMEDRALAEAAAGRLVPLVHRFPLAEAARAHRALETRGTVGKVVLEP